MCIFLIQSLPNYASSKIILTIKSITARRIFTECPEVKKKHANKVYDCIG